uniref:Uncharacterized protein n=1 Tax=Chenopodium quinoa TaxID=63459 RepID=A0A803MEM3_CHEQI
MYGADELLEAALEGRAEDAVEILTKDPTLIQIGDAAGDTAFHVAARAGHDTTISKMIEFLEMNHGKISRDTLCEGNAEGDTPLHLALKNGHIDAATLLAKKEPRVIYKLNMDRVSPFELAQRAGFHDLCIQMKRLGRPKSQFLRSDIYLNLVRMGLSDNDNDEEWIRLFKAAARGKLSVIAQILDEDFHLDILRYKDTAKCTVLHIAAYYGQTKALMTIAELMQSESDFKKLMLEGDRFGNTPLYYAIEGGQEKTAIYMVKVAPRATYKDNNQGDSPLCLAVNKGYSDLVKTMTANQSIKKHLLSHAKNVFIAHTALEKRNLDVLKAIMEGLPELIDSPNKKGWKPLSFGAFNGYFDEVCYIVQEFPECVMIKDGDGTYPIHKAITGGHVNPSSINGDESVQPTQQYPILCDEWDDDSA